MRVLSRLALWLKQAGFPGGAPVGKAGREPARTPENMTIYAVGDIHGERALLEELLELIRRDAAEQPDRPVAVFLGDYIDRGPDSRGVLALLCGDPLPGFTVHRLLGNHEQAMLSFLDDPLKTAAWLDVGGVAALDSYGVRMPPARRADERLIAARNALDACLPQDHRDFLRSLALWVALGDYAFVHAGIRPGVALAEQSPDDLLWIRDPFLGWPERHEKVIVHGHTVRPTPQLLPNRIGIDTGAYATGVLTAVVLKGSKVRFIQTRR